MQGASAIQKLLEEPALPKSAVFVIWEKVVPTDYFPPGTRVLRLVSTPQAAQYWDPRRDLSRLMGEKPGDDDSIVWDWVGLYASSARWDAAPPAPVWSDRPVEDVIDGLRKALASIQ